MSNTDALKEGYEAFGRGDLKGATATFSDDIRWENPEAPQMPNNGVTEGKDAVIQFFGELGNYWESFDLTPMCSSRAATRSSSSATASQRGRKRARR